MGVKTQSRAIFDFSSLRIRFYFVAKINGISLANSWNYGKNPTINCKLKDLPGGI
ncbi:hypothetical protein JXJ21_15155 [candidate division KSB1 bacterium]|nr:hypothetical protein [candidate division KSB1 bacterium]